MGKPTREVLMKLLIVQDMLNQLIEKDIDGEGIIAINLSLEFAQKAMAFYSR